MSTFWPPLAPIAVIILDGHAEARAALASAFGRDPEFRLLGDTGDPKEAIRLCSRHQPQVVLVDARRTERGLETCRAILKAWPAARLVVLATFFKPGEQRLYHNVGAAACLLKGEAFRTLAARLKSLIQPRE